MPQDLLKRDQKNFRGGLCNGLIFTSFIGFTARIVPDARAIDMTSWKPAPYIAVVLFLIVMTVDGSMAKF